MSIIIKVFDSQDICLKKIELSFSIATLQRGGECSCARNKKWKKGYALQGTRCIFADVLASPLLHTGFTSRRSSRFSIFTRLWFHFVEFVEIFRFFWSPGWYIESIIRILREEVSKLFLIFKLCFQLLVAIESIFFFFFSGASSSNSIHFNYFFKYKILLFVDDDKRDIDQRSATR